MYLISDQDMEEAKRSLAYMVTVTKGISGQTASNRRWIAGKLLKRLKARKRIDTCWVPNDKRKIDKYGEQ